MGPEKGRGDSRLVVSAGFVIKKGLLFFWGRRGICEVFKCLNIQTVNEYQKQISLILVFAHQVAFWLFRPCPAERDGPDFTQWHPIKFFCQ